MSLTYIITNLKARPPLRKETLEIHRKTEGFHSNFPYIFLFEEFQTRQGTKEYPRLEPKKETFFKLILYLLSNSILVIPPYYGCKGL